MAASYDTIFRGGTVVNQDGVGRHDVAVSAGRIAAIGELDPAAAGEVVDCTGLHVLPGVIDSHVHFREPGGTEKEDLETGSRAAVAGGVTAVFDMPNTRPTTTTAEALADKVKRASGRMLCDFAFWVGATRENTPDLPELERLPGAAGVKVFIGSSTGDLLVEDDPSIRAILERVRRRPAFHSEDEPRLLARMAEFRRDGNPASHSVWRDVEAARLGTERLIALARATGARIHILHVSTAAEMALLAAERVYASVEVTPHHLTLTTDDYARWGTRVQVNPPIRAAEDRAALWQAVASGLADTIGSDHAPHTAADKDQPYPAAPSGFPGTQTLVPLMLDAVNAGRLTLERFVDLTAGGPARLFGIAGKGRIAEGYDADLTIVDMQRRETVTDDWMQSRAGWTSYAGRQLKGWPVGTVVRGRRVMWDGEVAAAGEGAPVRFVEALPRR
jgi:dihydroorotase